MSTLLKSSKLTTLTAILLATTLTASCGTDNLVTLNESELTDTEAVFGQLPSLENTDDAAAIAAGARTLGGALLAQDNNTNAVLSPWALSRAIGQLRLGADGETATQIDAVLGFPESNRDAAFSSLVASLVEHDGATTGYSADDPPEHAVFRSADGLFIDKTLQVEKEFLTGSRTIFDSGVYSVDFLDDAAEVMGAFVNENTGGLIPTLPSEPQPGTKLSILSANFFAAQWNTPFAAENTQLHEFVRADGTTVDVQRMHGSDLELRYLRGDDWQAVELPYTDGFVMRLALPNVGVPVDTLLTPEALTDISAVASAEAVAVNLSLPRWDMKYRSGLTEPLKDLGLSPLFTPGDFDGIAPQAQIHRIDQETTITVAERGTVAAAVVTVGGGGSAEMPEEVVIDMNFDHPFSYSIVDTETDTTIFMGKMDDPTVTG